MLIKSLRENVVVIIKPKSTTTTTKLLAIQNILMCYLSKWAACHYLLIAIREKEAEV